MILGIDPGSKELGLCLYDEKKMIIKNSVELRVKSSSLSDKIKEIEKMIALYILDHKVDSVAIEKMFILNKKAVPLLAIQIVIVGLVKKMKRKLVEYAPTTWKKFMGNGRMDKKESADMLIDVFGITGLANDDNPKKIKYNLNVCDATAIAICAHANNFRDTVNVSFEEYIKKLK